MNWIWIVLLLCCCKGNNNDNCIQPRREYPRPPFAPDYGRDCDRDRDRNRDHDCGCRASEMDKDDCEE